MDPIALREKNAVRDGTKAAYGPTYQNIGYLETLAAIRDSDHYKAPLGPNQGRGVACGYWGNYGGPSTATVNVGEDGSILVTEGSPDIGGSRASISSSSPRITF